MRRFFNKRNNMRKFYSVLVLASCLLVSPLFGAVEVVFSERALVNADTERGQLQMYAGNETYVAALTIRGWQAGKEQTFNSRDVVLGGLSMLGKLQGQDTAYIDIIEVLNGQLRIAGDTMNAYRQKYIGADGSDMREFVKGKHELFPIPWEEVRLSGLSQNTGY